MKALINFVKKVFGVIRIIMETLLALYSIVATFAVVVEYKEKELCKKELGQYKPKPQYQQYQKYIKTYDQGLNEGYNSGYSKGLEQGCSEGWDDGYRYGYCDGWKGNPSEVEIEDLGINVGETPNDKEN